jgi:hypothetical protein
VIATVGGTPITRSRIEAARSASPGAGTREVLDRLVELEVLAQESFRRGAAEDPAVQRTWREALVQTYLGERFERHVTPDQIGDPEVRRLYGLPQIRKLYDHADAWRMAHLFIGCCDATVEDCTKDEVQRCFQDAARPIHEVHDEVKRRAAAMGIEGDPERVKGLLMDYRAEVEDRLPQLAYRDRAFYYDPKKPHAEQKGYNILAEVVARTVIDAPLGVLQPPVQSAFGWHVLVKLDHIPESRRGPDDPEVAADIRKNAFPGFREAKFRELVAGLRAKYAVAIDPAALEVLGP